jgi:hypothetical protein
MQPCHDGSRVHQDYTPTNSQPEHMRARRYDQVRAQKSTEVLAAAYHPLLKDRLSSILPAQVETAYSARRVGLHIRVRILSAVIAAVCLQWLAPVTSRSMPTAPRPRSRAAVVVLGGTYSHPRVNPAASQHGDAGAFRKRTLAHWARSWRRTCR